MTVSVNVTRTRARTKMKINFDINLFKYHLFILESMVAANVSNPS
jgi:hypothetical protein